jgi:hypothetical protein
VCFSGRPGRTLSGAALEVGLPPPQEGTAPGGKKPRAQPKAPLLLGKAQFFGDLVVRHSPAAEAPAEQ